MNRTAFIILGLTNGIGASVNLYALSQSPHPRLTLAAIVICSFVAGWDAACAIYAPLLCGRDTKFIQPPPVERAGFEGGG
jgi:hypothetical protein